MTTFEEATDFLGAELTRDEQDWSDTNRYLNYQKNIGWTWPASGGVESFTFFFEMNLTALGTHSGGSGVSGDNLVTLSIDGAVANSATIFRVRDKNTQPSLGGDYAPVTTAFANTTTGVVRWVVRCEVDYVSPGTHRYTAWKLLPNGTAVQVQRNSTTSFDLSSNIVATWGGTTSNNDYRQLQGTAGKAAFFRRALSDAEVLALGTYETMSTTPPDLEIPVAPATATAVMGNAVASSPVWVDVDALGASALMTDATTPSTIEVTRAQATNLFRAKTMGSTQRLAPDGAAITTSPVSGVYGTPDRWLVMMPDAGEGQTLTSAILVIKKGSAMGAYATRLNESTGNYEWVPDDFLGLYSGSNNTMRVSVPVDADAVYLYETGDSSLTSLDNPAVSGTGSYFEIATQMDPDASVSAAATAVAAEMLDVSTTADSHTDVGPMLADGYMERVWFPDFTWLATPAGASAEMRSSWFRSDNAELVEPAEALAEAIDGAAVATDRNIEVIAKTADARGRVMDPEEVNDLTADPYWNRVTGRSTQGSMPARTGATWLRLNERSGTSVVPSDAITGQKVPAGALTIVGDYTWGSDGPGGRRALEVRNAGIDAHRDDSYRNDLATQGASFEFAVRVAPGHTGRMDIANGRQNYFDSGIIPDAKLHVSIRNGYLYASTSFGGTSTKRIDDGNWHHIVITRSEREHPSAQAYSIYENAHALELWIDGMLDRSLVSEENKQDHKRQTNVALMARPDYYFGQDTGYQFRGDIAEMVYRPHFLTGNNVTDLYLDLFGYTPVRAGVVGLALADMTPGNKVESNMKRMLVLHWGNLPLFGDPETVNSAKVPVATSQLANWHPRSMNVMPREKSILTPMLGYGYRDEMDIGQYLIEYQSIESMGHHQYEGSKVKEGVLAEQLAANSGKIRGNFRNLVTGRSRFIDLQRDIDLSAYDVITFQGYPNPVYRDQDHRLKYEAFFESVNTALADGAKILMTDAFLAADLGWVSMVDEVPVLGDVLNGRIVKDNTVGGNDVRSYEIAPWIGLHGQTMEKPADGSMPKLQEELVNGSGYPKENIWGWDVHKNNGYRVVAEVEGLTDLPTWEIEDAFYRNRTTMIPTNGMWDQRGYKMANLSGEDFEWERFYEKIDAAGRSTGEPRDDMPVFKFVDPSIQRGLKAGDEFYDWIWLQHAFSYYRYRGSASSYRFTLDGRILSTWAIPPGALRIGTPLSTFRTHVWNDFGNEVLNPYRNHIRNAVVRAGDRLPDGRKVSGYAYLEFAEMPKIDAAAGLGISRDLPFGPGMHPHRGYQGTSLEHKNPVLGTALSAEDEYSFEWDWMTPGRTDYSGGGQVNSAPSFGFVEKEDAQGNKYTVVDSYTFESEVFPIAQKMTPAHPQEVLPHMTWLARGLAWLTLVNTEDAEVALTQADVATSTAQMVMPHVETDFDLEVTAGVAQASARIVDPAETTVKSTTVVAFPATASGRMLGLQGGYKAQAATSFADMLQNVLRPLDVEEVLFFTLTFNQKPIYLRMEEN